MTILTARKAVVLPSVRKTLYDSCKEVIKRHMQLQLLILNQKEEKKKESVDWVETQKKKQTPLSPTISKNCARPCGLLSCHHKARGSIQRYINSFTGTLSCFEQVWLAHWPTSRCNGRANRKQHIHDAQHDTQSRGLGRRCEAHIARLPWLRKQRDCTHNPAGKIDESDQRPFRSRESGR
jgi:hypothetical protein